MLIDIEDGLMDIQKESVVYLVYKNIDGGRMEITFSEVNGIYKERLIHRDGQVSIYDTVFTNVVPESHLELINSKLSMLSDIILKNSNITNKRIVYTVEVKINKYDNMKLKIEAMDIVEALEETLIDLYEVGIKDKYINKLIVKRV